MPDVGLLICGHGSRDAAGTREFAGLATTVAGRFPHWRSAHGFLEFASPTLDEAFDNLHAAGAAEIVAVPGMVFDARHATADIPSVLHARAAEKRATLAYGRALGFNPKMLRAAADRIEAAEAAAPTRIPRAETLLLVAGRGTTDPEANGDLAKLARMLCEGMEFGWGETCYAGVTTPLPGPALDQAAKLGYRRIVIMPYFLFTGALVERVYAATDEAAARHPDIEFLKAGYLNDHPLVIETFCERIIEALEGTGPGARGHPDHDHAACNDDWHMHAPAQDEADAYSLAPARPRRAG